MSGSTLGGGDDSYADTTAGAASIFGGAGQDTIFGGSGDDTIDGGDDDDSLLGGAGQDLIFGDGGNDTLDGRDTEGGTEPDRMIGGAGNDSIIGGAGGDDLSGGDGDDTVLGGDGDDNIALDAGQDYAEGGAGNDYIDGGLDHTDTIFGGTGADTILTGDGSDSVNGGDPSGGADGADSIMLDEVLFDDTLDGAAPVIGGHDTIGWGDGQGNDTVYGGFGFDVAQIDNPGDYTYQPILRGDALGRDGVNDWLVYRTVGAQDTLTLYDFEIACFLAGTLIATPAGEVPVESLRAGDLVLTGAGRDVPQALLWVGRTRTRIAGHPAPSRVAPVLIRQGALGAGRPARDLRVSPEHALLLDGLLVPAAHLLNGMTIIQETWRPAASYWHLELPAHGVVWAEGAPAESYFDDGNRDQFDNHPVTALVKDLAPAGPRARYAAAACFPMLDGGAALERLRARLASIARRMPPRSA